MTGSAGEFPVYHITDLFPDQLALIELLGSPEIIGSYETTTFLANPAESIDPPHYCTDEAAAIAGIGPPHAVLYTCPVVMVLGRPKTVLPNCDLHEVRPDQIGPRLDHWPER